MKRKLLLSILLCLFMCILNVSAEDSVKIKSIELVDKSEAVKELKEPTYKDLNLNLDLQLYKVGDFAEYKITIENLTDDSVRIINPGEKLSIDNKYIKYETNWDDESLTIGKNKSKDYNLTVRYNSSVPENEYKNNAYQKTDAFKIVVAQDESQTKEKKQITKEEVSPQTGDIVIDYVVLIVIGITLVFDIVYFAIIKKENKKLNKYILIGSSILLLISIIVKITYALIYTELNINSTIKIAKLPVMAERCYDKSYNIFRPPTPVYTSNETDSDYCFNWDDLTTIDNNEKFSDDENITVFNKLIVTTTTEMPETYKFNDEIYTLEKTTDISQKQDKSVIAGSYKNNTSKNYLVLVGGEGGVEAPENAPFLFSSSYGRESENNNLYASLNEYSNNYKILLSNPPSTPKNSKLVKYIDYMDLHNLDVSNTLNMDFIFSNDFKYHFDSLNLSGWNAENITTINMMFASSFNKNNGTIKLDFLNVNMPQIEGLYDMFNNACSDCGDINFEVANIDFENLETIEYMFNGFGSNAATINLNLSDFDIPKVTDIYGMFYSFGEGARNIDLDLSSFDTSKVTDMTRMFAEFGKGARSIALDLSSFDTSNVTDMTRMFESFGSDSINFVLDLSSFDTSNVTNTSHMFENFGQNVTNIDLDLSSFDTSNVTDMSEMFYLFGKNATTLNLDLSNFTISELADKQFLFTCFGENAITINLDLSNIDTSKMTNMSGMFNGFGQNATNISLDLSSFDTSKVTDMSGMFSNFGGKVLDLSNFDTSSVTDMNRMFSGFSGKILNLSSFDTSNVTNMLEMFEDFASNEETVNLDLSSFDTSKVTDMSAMFAGFGWNATSIDLDLSSFDTSRVTSISFMFQNFGQNAKNLNLDLSSFNTSKITNMTWMFSNFGGKTLDLSSFDTSNVTTMSYMFNNSKSLEKIYVGNKWNTSKVTSDYNMFYRCSNLKGGNGTTYSGAHTNKEYARIDTSDSPGYLTLKTN